MKLAIALMALLFVAFLAGCTATNNTNKGNENQQPQANPTQTPAQQVSPQDANQELNDFDSGLISEDDNVQIGEIV